MTHPIPAKLITAMVTPFTPDNTIDFPAAERLSQHLIDTGSDGIVVNGTTGESPTTTSSEKRALIEAVRNVIAGKNIQLIAGCGTNDTQTTMERCREAEALGVDGLLVVVPYYNKPSQKGMMAHYGALAKAVHTPVIIYNIPGRSVVNMQPETMAQLATDYDMLVGVKQSNADIDQVSEIRTQCPNRFRIWSGDDNLTLPSLALGAYGVISVASHLIGSGIRDMIAAFDRGDTSTALDLHLKQLFVFKELFFLPNPTVVKTCLTQLGLIEGYLRLPLVPPDEAEFERIMRLVQRIQTLQPVLPPR